MKDKCENIAKCSFYQNLKDHPEVQKEGWIESFCNNLSRSEECKRKILKNSGQSPPEKMTPTGEML